MPKKSSSRIYFDQIFDIVNPMVAGLDVHKKSVTVTIVCYRQDAKFFQETKTFGTFTNELEAMRDYLLSYKITSVCMESTGVYWKPVFNVFEEHFDITLCNASKLKYLPGKKTDVKDSEWLARLHCHGLVPGSYIPKKEIRDLRELTRYRAKLKQQVTAEKNRINKWLESANIKLSSVATDIFGKSGVAMIDAIVSKDDYDLEEVASLAKGSLKNKSEDLQKALNGKLDEHKMFLISESLDLISSLTDKILKIQNRIDEITHKKYTEEIALLDTLPGVGEELAQTIIAEIGNDMSQFPTPEHLCSWSCVSPQNRTSAGKKKVQE